MTDGTPVVGIHVPMLHIPGRTAKPTLNEVARHYVKAVRQVQPTGPYQLAGLCLGGFVAYEVGRILQQEGEKVSLVVLLDAVLPTGRHMDWPLLLRDLAAHPFRFLGRQLSKPQVLGIPAHPRSPREENRQQPVELHLGTDSTVTDMKLFADSKPFLETRLLALRATKNKLAPWDIIHKDMGWAETAPATRFLSIDSDHLGIVRGVFAKQVAATIMEELAK